MNHRHHDEHHPRPEVPGEDADLGELVMAVSRRLRRARFEALEPYGLPPHQARAFMIIARHCGGHGCTAHDSGDQSELRPSALAERLHIAPRSATEVVDALADRGLVVREPSATDRRATSLHVTDQGQELFAELHSAQSRPSGVFATLDAAEQAQLAGLLHQALAQNSRD